MSSKGRFLVHEDRVYFEHVGNKSLEFWIVEILSVAPNFSVTTYFFHGGVIRLSTRGAEFGGFTNFKNFWSCGRGDTG